MSETSEHYDAFSFAFNALKLKYKDYDDNLTSLNFLQPNDKINVFINLETAFKHLSMVQDLERKLILYKGFETLFISNIINLAAHYKRFFVNNGLDTKIYLYHTDFKSDSFGQYKYNEDYRSYYLNKFNSNPKFVYMTDALKETILPETLIYIDFIPNVYYIASYNIESSLVPLIIGNNDKTRKNLVLSGDIYDSQYSLIDNFCISYLIRNFLPNINEIASTPSQFIRGITKKNITEISDLVKVYDNYYSYTSLLSVIGDKNRAIDGISRIGPISLGKLYNEAVNSNTIQYDTNNPSLIGDIFHDNEDKEEFINNYYCTNLQYMYDELTDTDKRSIIDQIHDRSDVNSLKEANSNKFFDHPLILEGLLI